MYSNRVQLALTTMLEAHGLRHRKAGGGYEAAHTASVAMIVGDHGFDEDTVIAALLHDTLEDTELAPSVIRTRFGDHVLAMVEDVSEPPKPARWRDRKLTYIEQLRGTTRDGSLAVASADKIHNLSNMVSGLQTEGIAFASAFTVGFEAMLWYQRTVYDMLRGRWKHAILDEHGRQLEAFAAAAAELSQAPH